MGAVLIFAAVLVGGTSGAVGTGVVVGATVLAVSLITDYQYRPQDVAAGRGARSRVASAA